MLRNIKRGSRKTRLIHWILIFAFILPSLSMVAPKPAFAKDDGFAWMYKLEDPALKKLVKQLLVVIKILWKMLWSFEWLTHPRKFYKMLKKVFVVWWSLMKQLIIILSAYIRELETEIRNSFCTDRSCKSLGP